MNTAESWVDARKSIWLAAPYARSDEPMTWNRRPARQAMIATELSYEIRRRLGEQSEAVGRQLGPSGDKRPRQARAVSWRAAGTGRESPDAGLVANVLRRENFGGDHPHSSRSACVLFVSVALPLFCQRDRLSIFAGDFGSRRGLLVP
jgi:hypothetical protein